MRVVITGGAGFIGFHLANALLDGGHSVLVYDNMTSAGTERIHNLDGVELVRDGILNMAVESFRPTQTCRLGLRVGV